jgi:predicted nucleic acid-binding protein
MSVLVDTTVWSAFLRRRARDRGAAVRRLSLELAGLVRDDLVSIIGPIRQEVLSGFSDLARFATLRDYLREFDDEPIVTRDYERAAENFNLCRSSGVQGSQVDFLICAVAQRLSIEVFTADPDFDQYAAVIPVALYRPGGASG